jgi:hypothetical protein
VSRRFYHVGEGDDGQLRILVQGAAPRRWQLIHGSLEGRFIFGLVIGRDDDNLPIVEPMIGGDDGYPIVGRRVAAAGMASHRNLGVRIRSTPTIHCCA